MVHLTQNHRSGAVKSTLPGPREGSSILNVDLVVVAATVCLGSTSSIRQAVAQNDDVDMAAADGHGDAAREAEVLLSSSLR